MAVFKIIICALVVASAAALPQQDSSFKDTTKAAGTGFGAGQVGYSGLNAYNPYSQTPYNPYSQTPYNAYSQTPYNPYSQTPYSPYNANGRSYSGYPNQWGANVPSTYNPLNPYNNQRFGAGFGAQTPFQSTARQL